MTGKEAEKILSKVILIRHHLMDGCDRMAFFYLGVLNQELEMIIEIDKVSFNPTVEKEHE